MGSSLGCQVRTNLICYVQFFHEYLDNQDQVDYLHTNFCRVFDKIDDPIMLQEMVILGVEYALLRRVRSYLSGKK
ncbi:hypothetical protein HHI36_011981, partial [Cryptolaemus montrouzieri]